MSCQVTGIEPNGGNGGSMQSAVGGGSNADGGSTPIMNSAGKGGTASQGNGGSEIVAGSSAGGNAGSSAGGNAGSNAEAGAAGVSDESGHDLWQPMAESPLSGREYQNAVWAGNARGEGQLLIWSGLSGSSAEPDGALYDPRTDRWAPVSAQNAPPPHPAATVAWTGSQILIWGGIGAAPDDALAAYDPKANQWQVLPSCPIEIAPAVNWTFGTWTGKYFLLASRGKGARYDVAARQWSAMSSINNPFADSASAVWTGSRWIIWGGTDSTGQFLNTGAAYDPVADAWTPLAIDGAPPRRKYYVAGWTGRQFLVWGGLDENGPLLDTSAIYAYDPATDSWSHSFTDGPPESAFDFAVAQSSEGVLVWDGIGASNSPAPPGHILNWSTWSWTLMSTQNQPAPRVHHTATWTGRELLVWGGNSATNTELADGARYFP